MRLRCEYGGLCKNEATGYVQMHRRDHPLCDTHLQPKYHPHDLHKNLHRGEPKELCDHARVLD